MSVSAAPAQHHPSKSISICCPHCGGPAKVRSSKVITRLVKDLWINCQNVMCGATYKGQLELTAEISPPAVRNPRVQLRAAPRPFTPEFTAPPEFKRSHRAPLPANDTAANDTGPVESATA